MSIKEKLESKINITESNHWEKLGSREKMYINKLKNNSVRLHFSDGFNNVKLKFDPNEWSNFLNRLKQI